MTVDAIVIVVIVVSEADAVAAEIVMIAATATLAGIAKIAATAPILRNVKVVVMAHEPVKEIASSVTLEHRKRPLSRPMQRLMAQAMPQRLQGCLASQEKPVSHLSHVLIAASVASALSAAHVVNAVTEPSAHRVTRVPQTQRPQSSCP